MQASYSHNYTEATKPNASTQQLINRQAPRSVGKYIHKVLLYRVLCGNYEEGKESYTSPPWGCQSCVDNKKNPTIFVVFDASQCYLQYIIEYEYHP